MNVLHGNIVAVAGDLLKAIVCGWIFICPSNTVARSVKHGIKEKRRRVRWNLSFCRENFSQRKNVMPLIGHAYSVWICAMCLLNWFVHNIGSDDKSCTMTVGTRPDHKTQPTKSAYSHVYTLNASFVRCISLSVCLSNIWIKKPWIENDITNEVCVFTSQSSETETNTIGYIVGNNLLPCSRARAPYKLAMKMHIQRVFGQSSRCCAVAYLQNYLWKFLIICCSREISTQHTREKKHCRVTSVCRQMKNCEQQTMAATSLCFFSVCFHSVDGSNSSSGSLNESIRSFIWAKETWKRF